MWNMDELELGLPQSRDRDTSPPVGRLWASGGGAGTPQLRRWETSVATNSYHFHGVSLCRGLALYMRGRLCQQVRKVKLCIPELALKFCLIAHKFQFAWFPCPAIPTHTTLKVQHETKEMSEKKAPSGPLVIETLLPK